MQTYPLVSVIIPVYNAARFLSRCLDSIIDQGYENLEIICVNDGSTDNSAEVLEEYAQKDKRVKVINRCNGGSGAARNSGMSAAKGEYISFIDADDYLCPGLYKLFAENCAGKDIDIFMFNGNVEFDGKENCPLFYPNRFFKHDISEKDIFDYRAIKSFFYGNQSVCNKIYCFEFLRKNNIFMPEGKVFEDIYFYFVSLIKARKMKYTDGCFYIYTKSNPNSVTSGYGKSAFDIFDIFEEMEHETEKAGLWEYFRYALFQVEYEKIIEIMVRTQRCRQKDFFLHAKKFLLKRFIVLDPDILSRLVGFNRFWCLQNYSFEQFRDVVLLSLQERKFEHTFPDKPFFSVIVPVFNVENYLPFCIKSLINQTYRNFEIICIDDGSEDGSGRLLDEYAGYDKRMRVVHQKNKGLGGARNAGAALARGEYLLFVDSDDWLSPEALFLIAEKVGKDLPDIGIFGFNFYFENKGIVESSKYIKLFEDCEICNYRDIVNFIYEFPCAWSKFYRRRFFTNNNIYFPEDVVFEDILPHTKVITKARTISFCHQNLYYYRIRQGSIMRSGYDEKKITDLFKALEETCRYIRENGLFDEFKYVLSRFVKKHMSMHRQQIDEEKKMFWDECLKKCPAISEFLKITG